MSSARRSILNSRLFGLRYYAVRQTIEKYFGADIPPIVEVDAQNSVSRGAAIHCYNEYREQGFIRLTRIKLSDRMADDVFIRVNGKFEKLIPRETTEGSGIVDYTDYSLAVAPAIIR